MSVIRSPFTVVRYWLSVNRCPLSVVRADRRPFIIAHCTLPVARCRSLVALRQWPVACCLSPVSRCGTLLFSSFHYSIIPLFQLLLSSVFCLLYSVFFILSSLLDTFQIRQVLLRGVLGSNRHDHFPGLRILLITKPPRVGESDLEKIHLSALTEDLSLYCNSGFILVQLVNRLLRLELKLIGECKKPLQRDP